MAEKLKPCPFCGESNAELSSQAYSDFNEWWIMCACGGGVDQHRSEASVIKAWNTRASGWISVEDRLPDGESVLVWVKGYIGPTIGYRSEDDEWWVHNEYHEEPIEHVTHWQPLPPPPEEI